MHIREAEVPTLVFEGQLFVIHAEQMQDGCLQIVDMNATLRHVVTERIGLTVGRSRPDAPTLSLIHI